MKSDSPIPSDTRRDFVKKSLAASIIAAQPTLLSGLIRAQGGGGTGSGGWDTTEPGTGTTVPEPKMPETTDPWETTEPDVTYDINKIGAQCPNGTNLSFDAAGYAESGPPLIYFPVVSLSCQSGWAALYKLKVTRDPQTLTPHPKKITINIETELWIYPGAGPSFSRQSHECEIVCTCDPATGNLTEVKQLILVPNPPGNFYQWDEVCNFLPVLCKIEADLGPINIVGQGTSKLTITGEMGVILWKNGVNTSVNPKKTFTIEVESHLHS